jgi:hypothetical protein
MRKNTAQISRHKMKRAAKNRKRIERKKSKFDAYILRRLLRYLSEREGR